MYNPLELAEAFIKTGELADALDTLNQYLERSPGDEAARRLRAAVTLRTGDLSLALADLDSLAAPSADDHSRRSVILERMGDLDGALGAMETACGLKPDDERLAERLLHLLLKRGQIDRARALVGGLPATWRWLQWAGDLAEQAGDPAAAAGRYSAALNQLDAQFSLSANASAAAIKARLLLARADCYRQTGQIDLAEADYRAAGAIVPSDPLIPFNLGLLALERGDPETALALCREAFAAANDTLRDHMRASLQGEARYAQLSALLNQV